MSTQRVDNRARSAAKEELRRRHPDEYLEILQEQYEKLGVVITPTPDGVKGRQEALQFVRDYIAQHESAPSIHRVSRAIGVSYETARRYLIALEEQGYIRRSRGHRNVALTDKGALVEPSGKWIRR